MRWSARELLEAALRAARRSRYLDVAVTSVRTIRAEDAEGSEELVENREEHLTVRALAVGYAAASSTDVGPEAATRLAESAERRAVAASRRTGLAPVEASSGRRRALSGRAGMEEAVAVLRELQSALGDRVPEGRRRLGFVQASVERSISTSEGSEVEEESTVNIIRVELELPNGVRVERTAGTGGPVTGDFIDALAESAIEEARLAMRTPATLSPLYRGSPFTAILDHEAAGALAEAVAGTGSDRRRMYALASSTAVSVIDDPRMRGAPGSREWDDEGVQTRPKVLLSRGGYSVLGTRLTAAHEADVGNAYGLPGSPRPGCSNVYVKPGDWSDDEILEEAGEAFLIRGVESLEVDERGIVTLRPRAAYLRRRDGELLPVVGISVHDSLERILAHV
ncbi:MAG: metallopeptidase TldD-related protein, partial [Conexivisphaera sp.]